jgi:hypothetical protein
MAEWTSLVEQKALEDCQRICEAFSLSWHIVEEVPDGLAMAHLEPAADLPTMWRKLTARMSIELRRLATTIHCCATNLRQ